MNIRTLSNIFNQLSQALSIPYYHYGWNSDINTTTQNNFTGDNTNSKEYPALHCDFMSTTTQIKQAGGRESATVRLVFQDLQHYNNDSSTNLRSILDVQADLHDKAVNFISSLNAIGIKQAGLDNFVVVGDVNMEYAADAYADNLVVIIATFTVSYIADCPSDLLTVADITALPAPFNVFPPTGVDLEQL